MMFNCGCGARHEGKKQWHWWFAWRPVYVKDVDCWVWWQKVMRKGEYICSLGECFWRWEYGLRG